MPGDERTPDEIEREIEIERAQLRGTIEEIQDRFSLEGVSRQVAEQLREHGGEFGKTIAKSVRDNPMAVALTGVGLAWMIFGSPRQNHAVNHGYSNGSDRVDRGRATSAVPAKSHYKSDLPNWARERSHRGFAEGTGSFEHRAGGSAAQTKSVSSAVGTAGDNISDAAEAARDGVSDAASKAAQTASGAWQSAKSSIAETAASAKSHAEDLRRRLSEGTEHLTEEARSRVVAARERAVEARDQAERALRRGADYAVDFYDEHPLAAGALALAAGAAIAGALPRTKIEDEQLGQYSDDLFHEAERVFEEELAKAEKVVKAGASEAKKVVQEVKNDLDKMAPGDQTAGEAAIGTAKTAAKKVADATKSKAEQEKLGKPKI